MRTRFALLFTALLAIGIVSPASAALQTPKKLFGVMDDRPIVQTAAQLGFNVVKETVLFSPTQWHWDSLNADARQQLSQNMAAAQQAGISVILEMYPVPQYGPPRGPSQQRNTCMLAKDLLDQFPNTYGIEVGVEPNNNFFWRPQFRPDGTQASAGDYEHWLAACYDILKTAHPNTVVIGGSLASRGNDDPHNPSSGTSPTLFLQKFCEAYKSSGRNRPVMDVLDMHSYPDPENQDPTVQHLPPSTTITIADYDKLERLLECFDGTAQPLLPVIWGESGYNTQIPHKQSYRYAGQKPASVGVIDELTQGRYIAEQIHMAYCQPNSIGFINLHLVDDPNRAKDWQSGFAYTPTVEQLRTTTSSWLNYNLKQGWPSVRTALDAANNGSMKC